MRRHTRNVLAGLLQEALDDPADPQIPLLHLVCDALGSGRAIEIPLPEILRAAQRSTHWPAAILLQAVLRLVAPGGLLRARQGATGELPQAAPRLDANPAAWRLALAPEVLPDLQALQQRVGAYCQVLARLDGARPEFSRCEPLRWGFAQAAACFNAGLFFEAHEILEGYWLELPGGTIKQFVQGVIQISVALHHAREGRFFGAVNLLARGLEKTAAESGTVLGLDGGTFFPRIRAVREQLLAIGPLQIGRTPLPDIPPMRVIPEP